MTKTPALMGAEHKGSGDEITVIYYPRNTSGRLLRFKGCPYLQKDEND